MKVFLMALAAVAASATGFSAAKEVSAPSNGGKSVLTARISAIAIEGRPTGKWSGDARTELELHLSLAAGREFRAAQEVSELTIALGVKAPGAAEPEAFTSYAKLVGNRLYLWGDDNRCPGTLFAVYGFLEEILGVVWTMPGDANIVAPQSEYVKIPSSWTWSYRPPLRRGMMRGGKCVRRCSSAR